MIGSEQELKEYLDSRSIKIYERYAKQDIVFLVYYIDNKSNTIVFRDLVSTPVQSIRKFPEISKNTKLPIADFDIVLVGAYNETTKEFTNFDIDLDYHIYFKDEDKKETSEEVKE